MTSSFPYNPLDKKNLGVSVASALMDQPTRPMNSLESFPGAGIYVIYYKGDFPPYAALVKGNRGDKFSAPIYVGKAIPPGGRKGAGLLATEKTSALYKRLQEHAESIEQAENLKIKDFHCRYLVVDDIWIPLGESLLITRYSPIWNHLVDGFGNHDPGKGRYQQEQSRWDLIHPGRPWARKCKPREEKASQVKAEIMAFLKTAASPSHTV